MVKPLSNLTFNEILPNIQHIGANVSRKLAMTNAIKDLRIVLYLGVRASAAGIFSRYSCSPNSFVSQHVRLNQLLLTHTGRSLLIVTVLSLRLNVLLTAVYLHNKAPRRPTPLSDLGVVPEKDALS